MRLFMLMCFISTSCYSQIMLGHHDLPTLISNDTIVINDEVWIESVESEKHQRHKIVVLKRKLDKVRNILKKKQGYEIEIGLLIDKTVSLENERDSLLLVIRKDIGVVNESVKKRLVRVSEQLDIVKTQYFILKDKKRKVWWTAAGSIALNALLLTLIVAI